VTVQVDGIGTMAGPPARATRLEMVAGRAPVVAATAAVKSRLVVVEVRILRDGNGLLDSFGSVVVIAVFPSRLISLKIRTGRRCVS
jgi:hypothetical protein